MRTIWQSLAWKEWNEHKWKFVALLAIMWGVALLPLTNLERGTLFGVRVVLLIGIVPLAIFIGLGTAAGEQSRGTLRFLQALPIPMWRVALSKMAFGFATIFVPALLTLGLAYAWCTCLELFGIEYGATSDFHFSKNNPTAPFAFGTGSWFLDSALITLFVSGSLYLWTIAFGVSCKDEVSAGAVALSAIVGWSLVVFVLTWSLTTHLRRAGWPDDMLQWITVALVATAPGGLAPVSEIAKPNVQLLLIGVCIAGVIHFALAEWYFERFARMPNLEVRSPQTASVGAGPLDWLGPPRRSPFTAIAWQQFRESGPMVLAALAITSGTTLLVAHPIGNQNPSWADILPAVSMTIGFCLAVVMGIGVVLNDSKPGLNTFWRSRPINADLWFWTKFLSGLGILLAAVYGPMLLFVPQAVSEPNAYLFPVMHVAIYAAAVAMTALVRQAVYAAILSIAVAYSGLGVAGLVIWIGSRLGWLDRPRYYLIDLTEPEMGVTMLTTFVFCTLLAWLAVRNDWGQKAAR